MATRKKRTPTRRARPAARKPARPQRQQPETTRFRSIAPAYTVNDLQRSLVFYRDVLGFHPGDRWEDGGRLVGLELKAGSVSFNINQDDFAKGRDRVKGVGLRLYCLSQQDVDTLAMRIRGRGGRLDQEPHDTEWGTRAFSVTDPDGYKLTIFNEK